MMVERPTRFLWPDASKPLGISDHQRHQLARATAGRLGLLTGTPGTGKTYTTGALVDALAEEYGMRSIAVCAPTGKAAVRVTSAMHRAGVPIRATTIHTLLEISRNGHDGDGWGFKRNAKNPLDQLFVIVDEASMLDTDLGASLFDAIGPEGHCLLVGDPYQLPPVGHGAPLRDMIAAGVPCGLLTEIKRQGDKANLIVEACAKIKGGLPFIVSDRFDPSAGLNLRHIESDTPETQLESLLGIYARLPSNTHGWHVLWDVQVLIATNESGPLARKPVNRLLQSHLNPSGCGHPDHKFKVGDKIICLRNHWALDANDQRNTHYIANGEIGEVIDVGQPRRIMAEFGQPQRYILIPMGKKKGGDNEGGDGDGDSGSSDSGSASSDFDLAYAVTTHKGQGSEWPVVIVMIDSSPGARRVCSREWLYTAVSRASQLCITIGRLGVMNQMSKRPTLEKRKTLLTDLITGRVKR